ncbi:membrane protein involved in D-alanine export [Streptococcus gallinaceus]|uniref:D-alanyl-lipoteichoic acid biosynthesis protein DltB n=1 Tax=Streptococcus gallinaceus TaxID=165758 RepID=UPI00209E3849|nr:D-alanyl-lipoteichoic acid biosynthesis protein DltB [Streptococcus gallinaceus]MCP1638378.1 membrane protein involved in D-alanine export [Streptococcus gallinaceus]MCP1769535.1 membrane protein involved in D-alanine export [Streptococcus gallinaceus]
MEQFLAQLLHLDAYGNPQYFLYVIIGVLPIFIGLFFKKRFPVYEALFSFVFLLLMLTGKTSDQLVSLVKFMMWQLALIWSYKFYRKKANNSLVFYLWTVLSVLPLAFVKVSPLILEHKSLFGFLGISYITFRTVGMIIEMRDGTLKEFSLWQCLRFLLFFPTFTSGPIDRFKRFDEDYQTIPEREELLNMLEKAVQYLMKGFAYKFILSYILGQVLLPPLREMALQKGGILNLPTIGLMYVFGLDLFFDFAGYTLFALAISNLMGIKSPINFDQPFKSHDLKEFWNRWHMSLSFWFRDFVFMRLVKMLVKHKVFKNRNTTSSVAYLINMLLMGFWHGVTWYYIAYGLFHGLGLVANDAWLRKKKRINQERKALGLPLLPDNKWTQAAGIFITFHVVMISFLIFSGFLDMLWFPKVIK